MDEKGGDKTEDARASAEASGMKEEEVEEVEEASKSQDDENEWVCVGHTSTLGARTALKVHARQVTVLQLGKETKNEHNWTCIDSICYHAGGPLMQGSLHTVGKRTCVKCPWHGYLVDVRSGDALYMDLERRYRTKGVRQRVHATRVDADGHLSVRLARPPRHNRDDSGGGGGGGGGGEAGVASDVYAYSGRYWSEGCEVAARCVPDW